MKKITAMLNSPVKIAGFAACAVLLIGLIVFGTIQASAGINENKTIGMDKGVNVALQDAGFKAENVSNLSAHYDTEDGTSVYEVSFTANGFDYEYIIKASNGKILEADRDAGKVSAPKDTKTEQPAKSETTSSGDGISLKEAKNIALKHAGISSSEATFVKAKKTMKTVFKYMKLSSTAGTRNMTTKSECQTVKLFPTIRISKTIPFRPKIPVPHKLRPQTISELIRQNPLR